MKKWTKGLVIVCALSLLASLAGCGGAAPEETREPEQEIQSEQMSEVVSPAPVDPEPEEITLPPVSEEMTLEEDLEQYLTNMPLSRAALIAQLVFDGFDEDEATAAVDASGADWNAQAVRQAQIYASVLDNTRDELIELLEADQFTPEEAAYGADNCGITW